MKKKFHLQSIECDAASKPSNIEWNQIANLTFKNCPLGFVFNIADPDQSVEKEHFSDWYDPFIPPEGNSYRTWVICDERKTGQKVLQHEKKANGALLTGTDEWEDCAIEADVRQMITSSLPSDDDEFCLTGRSGIVMRHATVRRYYFFGIDGDKGLALYRRKDEEWTSLGHHPFQLDKTRYYRLRVEVVGTLIRCFLDDKKIIECKDSAYPNGKTGIWTNTICRFESIKVLTTDAAQEKLKQTQEDRKHKLHALRKETPQPVLWRELDIGKSTVLGISNEGRNQSSPVIFLLEWVGANSDLLPSRAEKSIVHAIDLNGQTLWRSEFKGLFYKVCWEQRINRSAICDLMANGSPDIVGALNNRFVVIDGQTGVIRHECDSPPVGPFTGFRGTRALPGFNAAHPLSFALAQLSPPPQPRGLIVSEDSSSGNYTLWAYNHKLELLWTKHVDQPRFGHSVGVFDIDGDGCDEILAGCHMLDQDGQLIWQLEGSESWEGMLGARHVDECWISNLSGDLSDGLQAVFACGGEGLILADAKTGRVLRHHRIGHVQFIALGNFRNDLPGSEFWTATRHGNYGIMTLFDSQANELFQFQPAHHLIRPIQVAWKQNKEHLAFFPNRPEPLTSFPFLWNAFGRPVVEFPEKEARVFQTSISNLCGDDRQEVMFCSHGRLRIYTQSDSGA